MTIPTPDAWQKLGDLRRSIIEDLERCENFASEIAEARKVTRGVAIALGWDAANTNLCVQCMASGSVQIKAEPWKREQCRDCGGRGYTTGVKIV